jgi:hypothetical protein
MPRPKYKACLFWFQSMIVSNIICHKNSISLIFNYIQINFLEDCKTNALTYGKMQNCLHLLSETRINKCATKNQEFLQNKEIVLKMASLLIKHGCNLNHCDYNSRETPIFKAILNNNYELVRLFICEGVIRTFFGIPKYLKNRFFSLRHRH